MSTDFRIAFSCTHLTIDEHVALDADRISLVPVQPIGSAESFQITANDIPIPRVGLLAPAQLIGRISGPFNIIKNENFITVRNSTSVAENIELPIGTRIKTDLVIKTIARALQDSNVEIQLDNVNGRLQFTDIQGIGTRSQIVVRGSSLAALGFDFQSGAKGTNVYPSWEVRDFIPECPTDLIVRVPRFNSQIRGNPVFRVLYAAVGASCRRCGGTFVENDYRYDQAGEPIQIVNEDLLIQASQKIVLTTLSSNPFHPWYGTKIHEKIGLKLLGTTVIAIQDEISKALEKFQELQNLQARVQQVSLKERLYNLLNVDAQTSPDDPTFVQVRVDIQNASGDPINLSIAFITPGAFALAGSNGQSLGLGV